MNSYRVVTAAGEKYTIKVDQNTIKKLKQDKIIVSYKIIRNNNGSVKNGDI